MATTKGYATTKQLGDILGIIKAVPSWEIGNEPTLETVDAGNDSKTKFYLVQKNIVSSSYTFYANTTELTETTDYVLDKDTGKITLTSAGVTALGTDSLIAEYKYFDNGMSDSYLTEVLDRAEDEVDDETNTTFTDGTAANPSYTAKTEIQSSPGYFNNNIIAENKPLKDIKTTLDGAHTIDITTISLAAGTGTNYPSTGYIIIGSEVISYTGVSTDDLTGCVRGALTSTAAVHSDGDAVHSTILFLSNTQEGTAVAWTVQPWNTYMNASDSGLVYSYDQSIFNSSQFPDRLVKPDVANRVKLIYYYGYSTIPKDITRLTLILAKEMLIKDTIGSSLIKGRDGFQPGVMSTSTKEIESIINSYLVIPMGNT